MCRRGAGAATAALQCGLLLLLLLGNLLINNYY